MGRIMKNVILSLIFLFLCYPLFAQNIYFSEPTSSHVDYIGIEGRGPIAYNMYAANGWHIDWYKARLTYPDGSKSNWQNGETGGWWVSKAGTYCIEGRAHGTYIGTGQSYDLYTNYFCFEVVDDYEPIIPQNLSANWSGGHPIITWAVNEEYDMDSYNIGKMIVNETGWANVATISKNTGQWIDVDVS